MATEVGQWLESFQDERGRPQSNITVWFYDDDGVTPATLYTDQTGTAGLANPLPTGVAQGVAGVDDSGNTIAFAVPGAYVVSVLRGGTEVYRAPCTFDVDVPTTELAVGPAEMVGRLAGDAQITAVPLADLKLALDALP
jgi:hypothetical protein